jgi:HlyD family secretion protein
LIALAAIVIHGCKKNQTFTYETAPVQKGSVTNTVTATGTLEATTSVVVGTQVSGIVEKLYVDFNSSVKKGQILAELDKTALRSSVDQALATLENSRAEMEFQESTYERTKALYDKNLVSKADYDQAKYNREKSKANLKTTQAQYDKALVNLNYATIRSPIDGVVMNRAVDEGQTVAASFNTPEIFTIANDLTQMQVEADIDEADIGQVSNGQRVEFTVDAFADETFSGTVMQIRLAPVSTSNVITYTVIINAPNPSLRLLPGMTANIVAYVEEINDVLTIPYKAVKFTPPAGQESIQGQVSGPGPEFGQGQEPTPGQEPGPVMSPGAMPPAGIKTTSVWIKDAAGIHQTAVTLGASDGTTAEVKSGLQAGDEVILSMTVATGKTKEKEVASNPFMPKRPGQAQKKTPAKS